MNSKLHPDASQLTAHLNEELGEQDSALVEEHLGNCPECQSRLEGLAANADWWTVLPECLAVRSDPTGVAGHAESAVGGASPDDLWYVEHQQIQSVLAPTDDPTKIGRLGVYEVVGIVGAGATAVVLKAFDGALNRFVAIKLMRPSLAASPIARQRFSREARAAASIVHENVIEIHGVSEARDLPYLVMPYVRGESLAKRIERTWPIGTEAILNIACQVADGLAAAHNKGLIHRDVKPSNILLGEGVERLKLTDFGLARAVDDVGLTRTGTLAGTPEYMSPEQASGNGVDHRSDLFSLGSVMYAMCTGRPPFTSDSCYSVLRRIVEEQPRPITDFNPDVPDWVCRLVSQLMEKDRELRIGSADTVALTLRQCLTRLHDVSHPLPASLRSPNSESRRRTGWLGAGVIIVAVTLIGLSGVLNHPAPLKSNPSGPESALSELSDVWDDDVEATLDEVDSQMGLIEELIREPISTEGDSQ